MSLRENRKDQRGTSCRSKFGKESRPVENKNSCACGTKVSWSQDTKEVLRMMNEWRTLIPDEEEWLFFLTLESRKDGSMNKKEWRDSFPWKWEGASGIIIGGEATEKMTWGPDLEGIQRNLDIRPCPQEIVLIDLTAAAKFIKDLPVPRIYRMP